MNINQNNFNQYLHLLPKNVSLIEMAGGFNNKVAVLSKPDSTRLIAKLMGEFASVDQEIFNLVPTLNPSKVQNEAIISNELHALNFPTPACIYFDQNHPEFAVYEWVDGNLINFNEARNRSVEKQRFFSQKLGKFVGSFHSIQNGRVGKLLMSKVYGKENFKSVKDKHVLQTHSLLEILSKKAMVDTIAVQKLQKIFSNGLELLPDNPFMLVHGDIYTGNLFVDQSENIVGLIDWADSAEIGDPLLDIVLSGRWLAFDGELSNFKNVSQISVFTSYIESYLQTHSSIKINAETAYKLIPYFDSLWHLKTLVSEHYKNMENGVKFFQSNLKRIIANSVG